MIGMRQTGKLGLPGQKLYGFLAGLNDPSVSGSECVEFYGLRQYSDYGDLSVCTSLANCIYAAKSFVDFR